VVPAVVHDAQDNFQSVFLLQMKFSHKHLEKMIGCQPTYTPFGFEPTAQKHRWNSRNHRTTTSSQFSEKNQRTLGFQIQIQMPLYCNFSHLIW
jgi:hypothetical protein